MFRCEQCGLIFNDPRLKDEELAALYDANYYLFLERPAQAVARITKLYNEALSILASVTSERQVIEVGCAKGWMLGLLRELGWSVNGIEISSHAAGFAINRINLPVYQGTLEEWTFSPEFKPFPVVFSTDVIEHVPDLHGFVKALAKATVPGGWLLLGTPNGDSCGMTSLGQRWLGFNPFHIRFLNRSNLTRLLETHGFEVFKAYSHNNLIPQASPAPSMVARLASAIGALSSARRAKAWLGEKRDSHKSPLSLRLQAAAAEAAIAPSYLTTEDGSRADDCQGDNLIVLARKHN